MQPSVNLSFIMLQYAFWMCSTFRINAVPVVLSLKLVGATEMRAMKEEMQTLQISAKLNILLATTEFLAGAV